MKPSKIFIFCLAGIFVLNFLFVSAAWAADLQPPDLKIQIGGTALNFKPVSSCGDNSYCIGWIGQYIGVVYRYGVGLAAVLAAVMIMVGGFLWLSSAGNPSQITKGKEFILSALTGLVLALFSFIILQTINPRLVALEPVQVKKPPKITDIGEAAVIGVVVGAAAGGGGTAPRGGAQATGEEAEVRDRLAQSGIDVWQSASGATVVSDLPEASLSYMEDVAGELEGSENHTALVVTGAAEEGYHSPRHGPNKNTFDIDRPNLGANWYIATYEVDSENLSWGHASYLDVEVDGAPMTAMWVDEGDHYHVELHPRGYRE